MLLFYLIVFITNLVWSIVVIAFFKKFGWVIILVVVLIFVLAAIMAVVKNA